MKRLIKNIFFAIALLIIIQACSRKKDKFLNRSFHSITTKYNFLYNGNNLLENGLQAMEESFQENFWTFIPIEIFNTKAFGNEDNDENEFTEAETKAVLSIQKHSMNIKGEEKNPIMDEAYFLLAKSRYYDNRFIPALEALNYILFKYPNSDLVNEVKIWKEKINIRIDQNERAIKNLNELVQSSNLNSEQVSIANTYIAQAYLNLKKIDSASYFLSKSKFEQNHRASFLLAQLYQELSKIDSANIIYDNIIKQGRKIPRQFYIQSYINKSKVSDSINLSIVELNDLANDIENKIFQDRIYFQLGNIFLHNKNNDTTAIKFFNKSISSSLRDSYLLSQAYKNLAEINFKNKQYLNSAFYYDSTLTYLDKRSNDYRLVQRKRNSLNDLAFYSNQKSELDSVFKLIKMSKEDRYKYFENYIYELKKENNSISKQEQNKIGSTTLNNGPSEESTFFYFYNPTATSYGKNEFIQFWGKRKLIDNWRWSQTSFLNNEFTEKPNTKTFNQDSLYSVNYYLNKIPVDDKMIDSLKDLRNNSYYKLGAIYRDQFKEYKMSNELFNELINNSPSSSLHTPSKYFIYKNLKDLNLNELADVIKNEIIRDYPDSKYSKILLSPDKAVIGYDSSKSYDYALSLYDSEDFIKVIDECNKSISMFSDEPIISKFELLKAVSVARVYGFNKYKESLSSIALNYSTSFEGKKAEELIRNVLPLVEDATFSNDSSSEDFKIVFQFAFEDDEKLQAFSNQIKVFIESLDVLDLNISKDYYNNITKFVVLHGLKSYDGALGLLEILKENDSVFIDSFFVISSENYRTIQIHKNLNAYLK